MKRNLLLSILSSRLTRASARQELGHPFKFLKASTPVVALGWKSLFPNHHHGMSQISAYDPQQEERRAFHSSLRFFEQQERTSNHECSSLTLLEEQFQQVIQQIHSEMSQWNDDHPPSSTPKTSHHRKLSNILLMELFRLVDLGPGAMLSKLQEVDSAFDRMRDYLLYRELHLIFLKGLFQEWFDIQKLQTLFEHDNPHGGIYKYPKLAATDTTVQPCYKDETHFLCCVWDSKVAIAAALPRGVGNRRVFTKQDLIANFYWLFTRFRDMPTEKQALIDYAKMVLNGYKETKEAYLKSVRRENVDDFNTRMYDVMENVFAFTRETFTEDEFDWFEDLETNLPLHLGACLKAIEILSQFKHYQDYSQMLKDLDNCVKINPNNPYILYLKASLCRHLMSDPRQETVAFYQAGIESCNAALDVMKNHVNIHFTSASPQRDRLTKTRFDAENDINSNEEDELAQEPIPDLKFTPILFLRAGIYNLYAANPSLHPSSKIRAGMSALNDLKQVERFSRMPSESSFLNTKGYAYYCSQQFEKAATCFAAIEKFEHVISRASIIQAICSTATCVMELGYTDFCLEKLEEYIVKYNHHPSLVAHKLDCHRVSCRSKDDLKNLLPMLHNFANSLKNTSQTDPENFKRYYAETIGYIEKFQKIVDNPSFPERWG
ncbi:hypothetical protein C9374_000322 [Naegleria lovaniensis]|uniref:Uncharacterized protein n=1 Tax=Naegleria lovaniensis TaxID=51637 RepID=A0AA88KNZ4_NAELO|nr:uncharacterized protein C9374_000322 [Naegleria lovaniensis]KAG2388883.1 hypothetical protein C9374_000322 [Naegleria lovaniensis]